MMTNNKDRLIYANEVIEEIDEIVGNINFSSPYQNDNHLIVEGLERARDCVLDSCTVDAVPVVHGKWIKDDESIYCSVCGFETSSLLPYVCDGEKWVPCYANKYCGNCGAKMDGGQDEK